MKNLQPLVTAFNHILENPAKWNQTMWHCNSSHCFLGWVQVLHDLPHTLHIGELDELTGIPTRDLEWLSDFNRTLFEIRCYIVTELSGQSFFSEDGYSRLGYNRDGYDRNGFDRNGYDRDGYDWYGRDERGYDRDGFNPFYIDECGHRLQPISHTEVRLSP